MTALAVIAYGLAAFFVGRWSKRESGTLYGRDAATIRREMMRGTPRTPERERVIREAEEIYGRFPPDHQAFVEARASGRAAFKRSLDKRRKPA